MYRNMSEDDEQFISNSFSLELPPSPTVSVPILNDKNISEFVDKLFNKNYQLHKRIQWKLPPIKYIFKERENNQTVPELRWIKNRLNQIKDQLNGYSLEAWSKFTATCDPTSSIAWYVRTQVKAEFVTRAWCKFYECLATFPIVKVIAQSEFNSVHLCEAPGAFISALNHYLKLNHPKLKFNWCATSLNPFLAENLFDSTTFDDRLMIQTLDNWEFGKDFTGNINSKRNVEQLVDRCRKMGPISLVTADGSEDCTTCPNNQENKVHYLHFAEVVAALQVLAIDGTFVIKVFTIFELTTVSLLYFLVNVFDKVDVFKPVASKQGNSEVYVICSGYQRNHDNMRYVLEMANRMPNIDTPMFALDLIPKDFINQVHDLAKMFMGFQAEAIQSNIYHFQKPTRDKHHIHELRYKIVKEYCRLYRIKSIPERMKLLYNEPVPLRSSFMAKNLERYTDDNSLGLQSTIPDDYSDDIHQAVTTEGQKMKKSKRNSKRRTNSMQRNEKHKRQPKEKKKDDSVGTLRETVTREVAKTELQADKREKMRETESESESETVRDTVAREVAKAMQSLKKRQLSYETGTVRDTVAREVAKTEPPADKREKMSETESESESETVRDTVAREVAKAMQSLKKRQLSYETGTVRDTVAREVAKTEPPADKREKMEETESESESETVRDTVAREVAKAMQSLKKRHLSYETGTVRDTVSRKIAKTEPQADKREKMEETDSENSTRTVRDTVVSGEIQSEASIEDVVRKLVEKEFIGIRNETIKCALAKRDELSSVRFQNHTINQQEYRCSLGTECTCCNHWKARTDHRQFQQRKPFYRGNPKHNPGSYGRQNYRGAHHASNYRQFNS